MPPRKPSRQSTLAFGRGAASSRISKPVPSSAKAKASSLSSLDKPTPAKAVTKASPVPTNVLFETTDLSHEAAARNLKQAQLKEYYTQEVLNTRKHRPLHQEELSLDEKILRHFDLSPQYGPCVGVSRVQRWKRADTMGLRPPLEVLAVALKAEAEGEKQGRDRRRAYIDDYLSSRTAGRDM